MNEDQLHRALRDISNAYEKDTGAVCAEFLKRVHEIEEQVDAEEVGRIQRSIEKKYE